MLRSTDAETVATLFQRVAETHALSASVPLNTNIAYHCRDSSKAQVFDHALRVYPNNRLTVQQMKPDRCTGAAPLRPTDLLLRKGIPDRLLIHQPMGEPPITQRRAATCGGQELFSNTLYTMRASGLGGHKDRHMLCLCTVVRSTGFVRPVNKKLMQPRGETLLPNRRGPARMNRGREYRFVRRLTLAPSIPVGQLP